mgnify:CR=1 FL=1
MCGGQDLGELPSKAGKSRLMCIKARRLIRKTFGTDVKLCHKRRSYYKTDGVEDAVETGTSKQFVCI